MQNRLSVLNGAEWQITWSLFEDNLFDCNTHMEKNFINTESTQWKMRHSCTLSSSSSCLLNSNHCLIIPCVYFIDILCILFIYLFNVYSFPMANLFCLLLILHECFFAFLKTTPKKKNSTLLELRWERRKLSNEL